MRNLKKKTKEKDYLGECFDVLMDILDVLAYIVIASDENERNGMISRIRNDVGEETAKRFLEKLHQKTPVSK